ncbi:membrane protein [Dictyobacter sp. S3.2.2.5]|uniref:Membrane protein n=1 Tax=Dictyobacter halimunensis TaxID=3026934 RepID=A0ABQ6FTB8_9CHLR|nr:membrane protein [Dictyobacter sp. S3.2.2.5]
MANIQKTTSLVFGIVFLLIGILGFVPALTPGGALLGLFMVNGVHSVVHLLFGILGIAAAFTGMGRFYNRAGGIIYLLIAILGFIPGLAPNGMLLGLVMINLADNFLHIVIGVVLTAVGFALQDRPAIAQRA